MSTTAESPAAATFSIESPLALMRRADPLARAISRLHLNPFLVALVVAVYAAAHAVALPAVFGHLWIAQGIPGALDNWPDLVIILVAAPLVIGYYAWQPAIIQAMYAGLAARIGRSPAASVNSSAPPASRPTGAPAAAAWATEILSPLGWRVWAVIAVVVGALECLSWILDLRNFAGPTRESANWLMISTLQPLRFIIFYAVVFILVRQVLVLIGLVRFFGEFAVEIQPLHPDRAGGLRVLGDYVLTSGMLSAVIGLVFGMDLLRGLANPALLTPEFYGELAVYFVVAPTAFFLPLWSAHTHMAAAKRNLLAEIAEQVALEYDVLLEGLRRDELKPEEVMRLEAIQKIY